MSIPVFYVANPVVASLITLDTEASKHVTQVLRMKKGDQINVSDGMGSLFLTTIIEDDRRGCTVSIVSSIFHEKKREICIAISLLKNASRFEWFLEKATELGVSEIIPLLCQRTERQQFKISRAKNILTSAMLQSQQQWLPTIHEPLQFNNVVAMRKDQIKLIAHCEAGHKKTIKDYISLASGQIIIGPEGDFSKDEISVALKNDYIPVSLGETRLRTETAGVVAASFLC